MLSPEDNELITRIGPGPPMGNVLRRYWIPALLTRELAEPDGAPVRVQLLGEKLVAFRDSDGRIGLVDEFCPHRRASLWFGRNEEGGLRCVYHGWKFDVDGNCVEQMNEPEPFCHKVRLTAYPTVEMGGVVWAYMGPRTRCRRRRHSNGPRCRKPTATSPRCGRSATGCRRSRAASTPRTRRSCIARSPPNTNRAGIPVEGPFVRGKAPMLEVDITDYGYRYVGIRPLDDDKTYVRSYHFVMPFTQIRPQQLGRRWAAATAPISPATSGFRWTTRTPWCATGCTALATRGSSDDDRMERGNGNGPDYVEQSGEFRSFRNKRNNWMIDRKVQKYETFTGIDGINTQDRAVQEGMGPIVDRSKEHLGPADRAIIATRRLLLNAVKTVQAGGNPPGTDTSYYQARAIEKIFPRAETWRETVLPEMYAEDQPVAAK